jgi:deoxyribose-phosphate aldolase
MQSKKPYVQGLMRRSNLAPYIDHTLLRPDARPMEVANHCREAVRHGFKAVCVNPFYLGLAAGFVAGQGVLPITVVGFPLGATLPSVKAFEAREAVKLGAREIDMVMNVGQLKTGKTRPVLEDIAAVVQAAAPYPVKVILETGLLTDEEKRIACRLAVEAKAAFVKTCTGFGPGAATVEDVRLLREEVGPDFGVKASGGVDSAEKAWALINAGATRIGASRSTLILGG